MKPAKGDFWSYVEKTESCWLWRGGKNHYGYGSIDAKAYGESLAHRYSWNVYNGPPLIGVCVLHRCDTPACVNPEHLFLGTRADNNADRYAKGRDCRGEANPAAKLTREQVQQIRQTTGTNQSLAEAFGVAPSRISDIRHLKTWWP